MLDVVTERDLIADLRRLLADGLVEVDQETQIIGGPDPDAPRITLTAPRETAL